MLRFNFDSYKMLAILIALNILLPISHSMRTTRNVAAAEKAAISTGEGNGHVFELEEEKPSKTKKQLHIAHYAGLQIETPPKGYGGKEKVVEMLVFEHLRMGYKVTLFATKNSGQLEKFNEKYQLTKEQLANFTLIPSSRDAWHYAKIDVADNIEYIREYLKVIVKNVRENNFDIVHIHSYDFFKHDPTLYNEFNAKTVTTLHGSLGDIELAKKMERYPNMQIVSITMNQRTHVHSDVPLNWVGNIYNAYPKSLYQFTPVSNPMPWPKPHVFGKPSKRGVPYLAFLGKFSPDKGALNAVKIALKANMELRIAAKAAEYQNQKYYEKILQLAKGNEHLIKYIGEIVDSEKSSFLGNAKALIFPIEWQEPFGLVMIEAMACGTPVIAPRSASVPEVLTDGVTGLLFDVELVENEAGEKMVQYTDEVIETAAELVKKLDTLDRHRIRFTFENQFSMEKMMNGYGEIYAKMLDTASAVIELERKSVLHIWMRAKQKNKPATLYFSTLKRKEIVLHSTAVNEWFDFIKLDMSERIGEEEGKQHYTFTWFKTDTEISYFYAFEPDNVQEVGIRPAFVHNKARHHPDLHKFSYHLRAPLGWNNEPNGFMRTNDNLYHVFYQFIPNESSRFWFGKIEEHLKNPSLEAMHWGHAVSKDLINWVHQPVYLLAKYKRDEALRKEKWVEHWFSGSAVPMGEKGLRMFVTSFNLARPNWSMQKEIRTTDAITAEEERVLIKDFPEKAYYHGIKLKFKQFNFRDPYVFKGPHGHYYMTVATSDTRGLGGVILLYRSVSTGMDSGWEFQNILLNDNRDGFQNIECTSMFPLGDPANSETRYALLYAREYGTADDPYRARDTKLLLGHFDGKQFKAISEQTLDFAFGSYGHQGFYDEKRGETLMMGWLGWWIDWDLKSEFYSSQTLPRVMRIASDNTLLVGLHPNVLKLLRNEENKLMPQNNAEEGENDGSIQKILLPNKTAYILLKIDQHKIGKQQHVSVELEHEKYSELRVVISQEGLELVKKIRVLEGGVEKRPLIAKGARPDKVHIFIDIDSLEIYGELDKDKGMPRWTGTARLTGNGTSSVESVKIKGGAVKFEAWQMNAVKMPGYYDAGENGHEDGIGGRNIVI